MAYWITLIPLVPETWNLALPHSRLGLDKWRLSTDVLVSVLMTDVNPKRAMLNGVCISKEETEI